MVFSSLTFLSFFLPCVMALYFLSKSRRYRNLVLLAASLLFYSWGEPKAILLLLGASLVCYFGVLAVESRSGSAAAAEAVFYRHGFAGPVQPARL